MKVALITDTHFGARNDNRIFQKYFNKFYNDVFFPTIFEKEIKHVIHLGDLVDKRRTINYVTLNEMRTNFLDPLIENVIHTHIIVGNHDAYYKNTNQINSIGQLIDRYTPFVDVYDMSTTIKLYDQGGIWDGEGGYEVCFIPWICADNAKETFKHIKDTKAQLAFGHLNINGYPMFKGRICDHGYDRKDFSKFDMVFSGHFHTKSNDDKIHYLGSPYQMNWNDYDDQKGFHILDLETREVEFIKNPYAMFHKLYYQENTKEADFAEYEDSYLKIIVEEKNNPVVFQKYMDNVYKSNPADLKIIEDMADYTLIDDSIDETEDTLTVLENYVNDLELDCDKKILNSLFSDLYGEALSVE
jgi:DNA repair exonuclease SbcCD nuclease subunit